jgi:hypothetical protein
MGFQGSPIRKGGPNFEIDHYMPIEAPEPNLVASTKNEVITGN